MTTSVTFDPAANNDGKTCLYLGSLLQLVACMLSIWILLGDHAEIRFVASFTLASMALFGVWILWFAKTVKVREERLPLSAKRLLLYSSILQTILGVVGLLCLNASPGLAATAIVLGAVIAAVHLPLPGAL